MDAELPDLLEALANRSLDDAQRARLAARLHAEPAARAAYREAMMFEAMLAHEFPRPGARTADSALTLRSSAEREAPPRWRWLAAAAALLLGALVFSQMSPLPPPRAPDEIAPTAPAPTIATVSNAAGARIASGSQSAAPGARLTGGVLELVAGTAEITFDCGAVVALEGLARLRLENEFRARLERGRVKASVPEQAIGFILATPGGIIRDLGTKFGVSVGPGGGTELHVIEGRVEATPAAAPAGSAPRVVLENHAVRLATASIENAVFAPEKFVTGLPPAPRLAREPIAAWSFDPPGEAAMKSSAGDFTLTLRRGDAPDEAAANRFTPGPVGSALTFDGETQSAWSDWPGIAGSAPRTVSLWVRIPADTRIDQPNAFIGWGRRRPAEKWQLATNCDTAIGAIGALRQEFGAGYIIGSTDLRDGRWHHVAVVSHGGERPDVTTHVKLYVDGRLETLTARRQQLIATRTIADPPDDARASTFPVVLGRYLGHWPGRTTFFWRGALDEVRVHAAALTPAEIAALAAE